MQKPLSIRNRRLYFNQFRRGRSRIVSIEQGESTVELATANQMAQGSGYLRGTIGCEGEEENWQIDLDWYSIGHRITSEHLTAVIPWDENSQLTLSTSCLGEGSRTYSIAVEGALSRIATVQTAGELQACPEIVLNIVPDGLLNPGMIAEGEIVFVDSFGLEQRVPVTLTAQSSFNGDSPLSWLVQPSNAIMVIFVLLAISLMPHQILNQLTKINLQTKTTNLNYCEALLSLTDSIPLSRWLIDR